MVNSKLLRSNQIIASLNLVHWYQPIRQLDTDNIIGFEALIRNRPQYNLSPLDIFKQAEQEGCRNTLDCQLILNAMASKAKIRPLTLFLNVFPSTLLEKWFLPWWDKHLSNVASLVLEILESEEVVDWSSMRSVIYELRDRGVSIALDDIGAGYSFLRRWVEFQPEYIKLDRYYASGLVQNSSKRRVIESLTKRFHGSTQVILEGIEKVEDLDTAKQLGINYAQGYLLGRPSPLENFLP